MLMENAEVNTLGCINSECSSFYKMHDLFRKQRNSSEHYYKNPHSLYSQENLLTGYSSKIYIG